MMNKSVRLFISYIIYGDLPVKQFGLESKKKHEGLKVDYLIRILA
jgi:hypothetical protein